MIVGEGRAGKTAFVNSIIGKQYVVNTESTIGINQLTCNVNYASLGVGQWGECKKPDKENESAIAENVLYTKKKLQHATSAGKHKKQANVTKLPSESKNEVRKQQTTAVSEY